MGETYLSLFTKFIPRLIWKEKPQENWGNKWGHRYGYLGAGNVSTSYNLHWLPEMYMNFGVYGVVGVSMLVGMLFAVLANAFWKKPSNPCAFALGMCMGSPFFFVESNLSMIFGNVIVSAITICSFGLIVAIIAPRIVSVQRARRG